MPPESSTHDECANDDDAAVRPSPHRHLPLHVRLRSEAREQSRTALPTVAGMVLYKFPWLISLRFVGDIGTTELAAAALATTLCNVTGMSLAVGMSSAMTTLTGQARGDLQSRLMINRVRVRNEETTGLLRRDRTSPSYQSTDGNGGGRHPRDSDNLLSPLIFLYRGLLIQMLLVLPIGIWWISGIEPMLLALGQSAEVSSMTQDYLRILTPGLWSYSTNWTLTAWLQAIEMADVPAGAAAVGLVLHVPFNMFFVRVLDWGYLGVAVATVLFQLIQPVVMLVYLVLTPAGYRRVLTATAAEAVGRTKLSFWPEARVAATSLGGALRYLKLAIPGIVTISEWWASEIAIFLAGRLTPSPSLALGGMSIYQSINTFCFVFSVGVSVGGATRVGNLLGAGDIRGAEFASLVSVLLAGLVGGTLGSILFWTPHTFFPSLFAPEETDLVLETSKTITLLSLYVFADAIQCAFNGVIKGCGRQVVTMPIVAIAYWVVALPLGYYISFIKHDGYMCDDSYFCGDVGLVAGMTAGTWVHMLLLALAVIGTTNWETEGKKAKERLEAEAQTESLNSV